MKSSQDVKERLLDVSERLFAQKGYDHVSIREITSKAGSNLASVNYYFGGKGRLYEEVFRQRMVPRAKRIHDFFRSRLRAQKESTPGGIIKSLAESFMKGPVGDEERELHQQLIAREHTNPTGALDIMLKEVIYPFAQEIQELIKPWFKGASKEDITLCTLSITALIIYFSFIGRIPVSAVTGRVYDEKFTDLLVDHITRFSLYGLNYLIKGKEDS